MMAVAVKSISLPVDSKLVGGGVGVAARGEILIRGALPRESVAHPEPATRSIGQGWVLNFETFGCIAYGHF